METKVFVGLDNFEVKSGEDGKGNTIVGYGSTWGNADLVGDIIAPRAFSKSLASGRKVKMLWMHDWKEPIGVWTSISEDEKGLRVEGKLSDTVKGNEIKALLKDGAIDGLSVSFRINDYEYQGDNRVIKEATLHEISVVSIPCNEQALVEEIKSLEELREKDIEKALRDAFAFSRKEAKAFMSAGFAELKSLRDASEEIENQINDNVEAIQVADDESAQKEVTIEENKSEIDALEIKNLLNNIIDKINSK